MRHVVTLNKAINEINKRFDGILMQFVLPDCVLHQISDGNRQIA